MKPPSDRVPREPIMQGTFTAVVKHEAGWWIGWIEEIPGVN